MRSPLKDLSASLTVSPSTSVNTNTVLRNSSCAPPSKLNIILCVATEFKIKYYAPRPNFICLFKSRTWKSWERPPERVATGPFFLVDKRDFTRVYDTSSEGAFFDSVFY